MADHLYTYKRIWKTTIKRFLFTLENQPISPNPDVWMVQRRRISQHWKLAKVAFKKGNWRTVGIMLSKQTHVIVRPGDQRIPRNQRVHIQPRRTYYPERLVEFESAYWFKLNTIEQSLQFHDRNIPKILESFVDADRCCSMISRWLPRDNYFSLGDTRWRWFLQNNARICIIKSHLRHKIVIAPTDVVLCCRIIAVGVV